VTGYIKFALDGMLLQKRFDKTRQYVKKSHSEASAEVYQNRDYMNDLYLPGILLSHYLWRHHYLQHRFYIEEFLPLVHAHGGKEFYDIGVGTGFYSKEMLRCTPGMVGTGYDLSEFSLEYTSKMLNAWNLHDRYSSKIQDIISNPVKRTVPFIINIEVLEHLEDPLTFLKALYNMMDVGGYGLISAAITAPNADHIYLYNSVYEVIDQIEEAGFDVVKYIEDAAYEPETSENSVPKNAAIIVTK
jgi:2-polyprenyl-3-methyl-5-hydroxy-6-metoxy-1,4-benzoquinol methylase